VTARNRFALAALLLIAGIVALAWVSAWVLAWVLAARTEQQEKPPIGLMTSLPIYWGEAQRGEVFLGEGDAIKNALSADAPRHWVRESLEQKYEIVPLDTLAAPDSVSPAQALHELPILILAQPRPLVPADFAAVDAWIGEGGIALIFADPLLTEHSAFALGNPMRPEGAALMSPVLARWGLQQVFDESQPVEPHSLSLEGLDIPVHQYGRFEFLEDGANFEGGKDPEEKRAECRLIAQALIADCAIGKGRAVIVGDAAMLDGHSESVTKQAAFQAILKRTEIDR